MCATISRSTPICRPSSSSGDSTARNGADLGWAITSPHYFDLTKVNVANRAIAGRSARSYINEGSWDKVLAELKPGDYVLLQWGHNDGGPPLTPTSMRAAKARASAKSRSTPIARPYTTGPLAGKTTETVHTYGWYNRKYIADTRVKGATPVLLTVTVRDIWTLGASRRTVYRARYGLPRLRHPDCRPEKVSLVDMAAVQADRV